MDIAVIDPPVFPPVCVNCVRAADVRIRVDAEGSAGSIPLKRYVCRECATVHTRQLPPFDITLVFKRLLAAWPCLIPAVGSTLVAAVLMPVVLRSLVRGPAASIFFSGGLFVLFLLIALVCVLAGWGNTQYMARHPATSVTQAIAFSADKSEAFEPAWRTYTFRNEAYARQFREINQSRLWDKRSTRAQWAFSLRYWGTMAMMALFGLAALWYFYDEWVQPLWQWLRPYFDRPGF